MYSAVCMVYNLIVFGLHSVSPPMVQFLAGWEWWWGGWSGGWKGGEWGWGRSGEWVVGGGGE